jgi:DNA-binding protein HU-beta
MRKEDLVDNISSQTGISKAKALKIIDTLLESIRSAQEKKEDVNLWGFGIFHVKKRAQKKAQDILRKKTLVVPECYVPTFKPSKGFAKKIRRKKVI